MYSLIIFSFIPATIKLQADNSQTTAFLRPQEKFEDPRIVPSFVERIKDYVPVELSGYIKQEAFYDTRQVVGAGDDQNLFFPERQNLDPKCRDINAKGQGNMVTIETRLRATIKGPKINSADSLGVIETDFFGFNQPKFLDRDRLDVLNLYRMRHAFVQLDWDTYRFTAGQTWHPMFVPTCFPETISFNSGSNSLKLRPNQVHY